MANPISQFRDLIDDRKYYHGEYTTVLYKITFSGKDSGFLFRYRQRRLEKLSAKVREIDSKIDIWRRLLNTSHGPPPKK